MVIFKHSFEQVTTPCLCNTNFIGTIFLHPKFKENKLLISWPLISALNTEGIKNIRSKQQHFSAWSYHCTWAYLNACEILECKIVAIISRGRLLMRKSSAGFRLSHPTLNETQGTLIFSHCWCPFASKHTKTPP